MNVKFNIKEIKNDAFHADNQIHTIFFEGTEEQWESINLYLYRYLWADVEIIFVPEGVDAETVMAACNE